MLEGEVALLVHGDHQDNVTPLCFQLVANDGPSWLPSETSILKSRQILCAIFEGIVK
jgi:hypothetical protein